MTKLLKTLIALPLLALPSLAVAQSEDAIDEAVAEAAEAAEAAMEEVVDVPPPQTVEVPRAVISVAPPPQEIFPRDPEPIGDPWSVITPADYPPQSYVAKEEGLVEYNLSIDADGVIKGCKIVQSSGHARLDDLTCRLVTQRLKFLPARDANERAVPGNFGQSHRWRISEPEFGPPMAIEVAYSIDETGRVSECEVIRAEGKLPRGFERNPCPGRRSVRGPYRDEQGNPVAKRILIKFEVVETEIE